MPTTTRAEELKKQVNVLWKQAVGQLEEVKDAVLKRTDRFDAELHWLKVERDRLLKLLGEQTHKLATQGKLPMPALVKTTVDRIDDVVGRLVAKQSNGAGSRKRSGKSAAKKAPRRKSPARKKAPAAVN